MIMIQNSHKDSLSLYLAANTKAHLFLLGHIEGKWYDNEVDSHDDPFGQSVT